MRAILLMIITVSAVFVLGTSMASQTQLIGGRAYHGAPIVIHRDNGNNCYTVTNNGSQDVFVPNGSTREFDAFSTWATSHNVIVASGATCP